MFKKNILIIFYIYGLVFLCSGETDIQWNTSTTNQLALRRNGVDVWRFHFDPATNTKPFFDPVCVAGGPSLTWACPPDHVWHYGLWFSWKYINGLNYWEEKDGKSQGKTFWSLPTVETHADGSASIICTLGYRPTTTNNPVLNEQRKITISAPDADGAYHMDWTQIFTAGNQPVTLDRTPLPTEPNGASWGGYAGLSIRYAKAFTNLESIASPIGRVTRDARGRLDCTAAAAEQNGFIDGKSYGIALLAHPANPRPPGDWYLIENSGQSFYYINAAFLLKSAYIIAPNEILKLRYRVCIHPGRWNAETLRLATKLYSADKA